jgi:DNA-binding PadR family transcriptional regulator
MGRDLLGEFEHQVMLAILRLREDAYSVPVVLELERVTGREVAPAAVYIALRRLEKKGLVRSDLRVPSDDSGGRSRRYVELTPDGLERLREARQTLAALWEGVEPVLDQG